MKYSMNACHIVNVTAKPSVIGTSDLGRLQQVMTISTASRVGYILFSTRDDTVPGSGIFSASVLDELDATSTLYPRLW